MMPRSPFRSFGPFGLVLALALLTAAQTAAAQGSVRGTVTRRDTNTPVGGVAVVVRGTGIGTSTGPDGRYTLPRVPEGPQTLLFRWIGYAPQEATVTVSASAPATLDVALETRAVQLSEVVVSTASRAPERIVEAPAAISVVPPQVVTAISATGQAPLAFGTVPGVDVVQSGINDFNVNARGFNSSLNRRVLVLQDGRDLATPFLGSQEWSSIAASIDDLGRIEMVRGPGSALYGANAFSGVVNITTPTAREQPGSKLTLAGGELGTLRADFRNGFVFNGGKLGLKWNAGYNTSDTWSRSRTRLDSTDIVNEYEPATDSTIRKSREVRPLNGQSIDPTTRAAIGDRDPLSTTYLSGRLDYYADNGAVGTFESGIADSRNEVAVTGIGRVQITRTQRPWARAAWAARRFNLSAWYNGRDTRDPQWSLASGVRLEEKSGTLHTEAQYNIDLPSDRGRLVFGTSLRAYQVNTHATLMEGLNDDRTDMVYSGYGQFEFRVTPMIRLVGASRYDKGDLFDAQFSPKAAIVFSPNENHSFRATYNKAFQTPNYSEFFLRVNAGAPTASPRTLETALENFLATGRAIGTAGLPSAAAGLPWDFNAQTQVFALGNAALDVEKITGYEIGYKGNLTRAAYVSLDFYQNEKKDFVTDLLPNVNPAYPRYLYTSGGTDVPGYLDSIAAQAAALPAGAIPDAQRAAIIGGAAQLKAGYNALVAGTQGLLATLPNGQRALVVSYANAGEVTERGAEVGAGYQLTNTLRADVAYAYFDFDVKKASIPGDQLLPNTPKQKGQASIAYLGPNGLDFGASLRIVSGYPWAAGVFSGYIPAAQTVNANIGYQLTSSTKIFATGTNILDQKRFQLYGGSVIGRRVIAGLTTNF